jgi:chorismate lyase/3-hydroxybenzoate synthase
MLDYCTATQTDAEGGYGALIADIRFGPRHQRDPVDPRRICIGTPPIGEYSHERWHLTGGQTTSGWSGDIGYVHNDGFMFAHLLVTEPEGSNLVEVVHQAYRRLLAFVAASPCPNLLRIWNYLERVNDWEHGLERYQAFCMGRSQAFADARIPAHCFPAATAIGSLAPGLSIHLLAGRTPGTPIENPRQVSAYRYPPPYGPRPPSFARALCFAGPHDSRELAISGTSSITGHLTMHPNSLRRQLRETLRNLEKLSVPERLAQARPGDPPLLLKVYLRDPTRIAEVAPVLQAWAGAETRIMYLQGAICRKALAIEIEAHCTRAWAEWPLQPDGQRSDP